MVRSRVIEQERRRLKALADARPFKMRGLEEVQAELAVKAVELEEAKAALAKVQKELVIAQIDIGELKEAKVTLW